MRVEEVIKEESKKTFMETNTPCSESNNTQLGYLDNKHFKSQINGRHGGDMILE